MRLRLVIAVLISLAPLNVLRLLLLRGLLGYEIGPGCRIGLLTVVACRRFSLGAGSTIGRMNVFRGAFAFAAGKRLFIGHSNRFSAPSRLDHPRLADRGYAASIGFGDDCLVNDGHYLDAHGRITVGDGTWIAGRASQFLTHGVGVRDRDIAIGRESFIGSAVRFAPGAGVGDRTIVGIGSVVVGRIAGDGVLIAGSPAKPIRDIAGDLDAGRYRYSRSDWVDGAR
jgi:carbonic anhydrase/acetyltransferase-like protein (isoleucine patch superfamily)